MFSRALIIISLACVSSLSAAEQTPVGIVIRPAFFNHIISVYNDSLKPISFETCIENQDLLISGTFSFQLSDPSWVSSTEHLLLKTNLRNYQLDGRLQVGCKEKRKAYKFKASLSQYGLQIVLSPREVFKPNLSETRPKSTPLGIILIDPNSQGAFQFQPTLEFYDEDTMQPLPNVVDLMQRREAQVYIWNELKTFLTNAFGSWLIDQIHDLVFVQSIADLVSDLPMWKSGYVLNKDGLSIQFDGPPLSRRDSIFFSTPFRTSEDSIFVTQDTLEVYFNSGFLTPERVSGTGLENIFSKTNSEDDIQQFLRAYLKDENVWETPLFRRPSPMVSSAEVTLVLPTGLINEALRTVYRQGLLKFKTTIHLGKQAQGVISPEAPEVKTIIGVSPKSAPQVTFTTSHPRLEIRDYELQVNTEIEDRLIPSSKLSISAAISSQLHLAESTATVNLLLDPATFSMSVEDRSHRMSVAQKDLFAKIARGIWLEFLRESADLILFPSILEMKKTFASFEVIGIDVTDKNVYFHLNLKWDVKK